MLALCLSGGACQSLAPIVDTDASRADVTADAPRDDAATPDASATDAADAIATDVLESDQGAPDGMVTDVITADMVAPDVVAPDVVTPDVVTPDVVTPDVVMIVDAGCASPTTWFLDGDGDGYGGATSMTACMQPARYVARGGDCRDDDAAAYPGATERCDGVDRDCSGAWAPSVPSVCATIQAALDATVTASPASAVTITVAPGTYRENVVWHGARAVVRSAMGAAMTTITAAGAGPTVTFSDGEGADTGLVGFTVTGGSGRAVTPLTGVYGGGVLVSRASPQLTSLVVRDNTLAGSGGYGAGIALLSSSSVLRNVTLLQNVASYYGGGMYVSQGTGVRLENLDVRGNRAVYGGGFAIYFSTVAVTNAIVAQNRASSYGGGVLFQGASPDVTHAVIVGNTSETLGGGIAITSAATPGSLRNVSLSGNNSPMGGAIAVTGGGVAPSVAYSQSDANGSAPYTGMPAPSATEGNLTAAPRFVRTSGLVTMWDLHLDSGSPLVNAGDPMVLDADGTRSDIGAYGGPRGAMW